MNVLGGARFHGNIVVPGDKSESHRVVIISGLAAGRSEIDGLSSGADVSKTLYALERLGASVRRTDTGIAISGGIRLGASTPTLDLGNSGTGLRLLAGALSGRGPGDVRFVGDESLSARPMDRIAIPLSQMGAHLEGHGPRQTLPLNLRAPGELTGIDYDVPVPSAQVKGAILFAGLGARDVTTVREHVITRSATEDLLEEAGVRIERQLTGPSSQSLTLQPSEPQARQWRVRQDPSQAAFFLAAAGLADNGRVSVHHVVTDPARWGFLHVLERAGATVDFATDGSVVTVSRGDVLPFTVDGADIVGLDEVPILTVWASMAPGRSTFTNVGDLRHKEVARLEASAELARSCGAHAQIVGDDLFIDGIGGPVTSRPHARWEHDHRMVMATAIAGALGSGCTLEFPHAVDSSFPTFFDVLDSVR
jgi:3-phosphoshikimate 1-carboxyvinyltransferase